MKTIAEFYARNYKLYPDKLAFVFDDGRRYTFGQHMERVVALSAALDRWGVGPRARLAVLAPTCAELVDWLGVAAATGRLLIPLNWRLSVRETTMVLADAKPDVFVCHREHLELGLGAVAALRVRREDETLSGKGSTVFVSAGTGDSGALELTGHDHEALASDRTDWEMKLNALHGHMSGVRPEDPLLVIYTSGTTGQPKGVVLDQGGQAANSVIVMTEMALTDDDSFYTCLPMFHIGATSLVINFFARGCTNYIDKRFDPDAWLDALEREHITCSVLVPSLVHQVLDRLEQRPRDLSNLRTLYYSGAPMLEPDVRRALAKLGNVLYQAYGSTETGPSICVLHKEDHTLTGAAQARLGSCGRPVADVMVEIRNDEGMETLPGEVGLVYVKSRAILVSYLSNPEATKESVREGWVMTGDLARSDTDGYIYLVGRKKDLIISGGENVLPGEVEACICMLDGVQDVAVVGLPDATWGETVAALVVPKHGADLTIDDVLTFCKNEIAGYKKPRIIKIVEELPRNTIGKVDKNRVRDVLKQHAGRR
ncbi:MAG: long-chain fatty acid--CoA ligase [Actinobacteria bacterium]|nr:long-chain fatty acid--CoA ligase [Actinomycetota bacterium]